MKGDSGLMNITKYIAEQFGKPTGIGGIISTFIMNRMNQVQYRGVVSNLNCSKKDRVLDAIRVITAQHNKLTRIMLPVQDYESGPVSKQVLRVVMSYVDYINRVVWSKPV